MPNPSGQQSNPNSDISNKLWSPLPLYEQVSKETYNDITFVTSSGSNTGDSFVVGLENILWPGWGPQTLKVRWAESPGSSPVWVQIALLQQPIPGGSVNTIATSPPFIPGSSFCEYDMLLTPTQAGMISYLSSSATAFGLQAQVTTFPSVSVPCCSYPIPGVLLATLTNKTGTCTSLPNSIVLLTTPGFPIAGWQSFATTLDLHMQCQITGSGYQFGITSQHAGITAAIPAGPGSTCEPLFLVFQMTMNPLNPNRPCTGSVTITVTENPPQ
jgi:hypothetical protein